MVCTLIIILLMSHIQVVSSGLVVICIRSPAVRNTNSLCRKLGVETRVNLDTSTDFMQLTQEFGQIGYRGITSSLLTV